MRTLVISDLHLGARSGVEALRRPAALGVLVERLAEVDRLVLLGDVLELRHGPAREALAVAAPVLRAIGAALGPDGEVVVVPGNHDHAIVAGWLDWRGHRESPPALALEQRVAAERASWIAKRLTALLAPARVEVAYPGLWLRPDVYATHGHYLDVHLAVPTLERLAAGVMARLVGAVPDPATPDDYERVLAPLYALSQASAQRRRHGGAAVGTRSAGAVWRALAGSGRSRRARGYALVLPFRAGVFAANRAGIGPLQPDVGIHDLRRAGLAAIGEVARRLRLAPAHLVFGHTHRTGRLGHDDPGEWRTPAGTRLHSAGSWVADPLFLDRGGPGSDHPYWPGGAIALDGDGPPRLERLLADVPGDVLRRAAQA